MATKTFRLFKMLPGFLLGVATVMDLGATIDIYNTDKTPAEADYKAIASDWQMTGVDLKNAFEEYKVCVVPANTSTQDAGTIIPITGGSVNTSGNEGDYEASTNIQVTIKGVDLETASSGDGVKIVKVFVKNAAGTWSVA